MAIDIPSNYPAGIFRQEVDNSLLPTSVGNEGFRGAIAGLFYGCQPNRRVLVKTPSEFESKLGRATGIPSSFVLDWYAGYFSVGSTDGLWTFGVIPASSTFTHSGVKVLVDSADADSLPDTTPNPVTATATTTAILNYPNGYAQDEFPEADTSFGTPSVATLLFVSRFVGTRGDNIKVVVEKPSDSILDSYTNEVTSSVYKSLVSISVFEKNSVGTYEFRERHYATLSDAVSISGQSLFVEDVVNSQSAFIFVRCDMKSTTTPNTAFVGEFSLGGGSVPATAPASSDVNQARADALKTFSDGDDIRLHAVCVPEYSSGSAGNDVLKATTTAFGSKLHGIVVGQASPVTQTTYDKALAKSQKSGVETAYQSWATCAYGWGQFRDPFTKKKIILPNSIELFKAQFEVAKNLGIHEAPANENVSFSRCEKQYPKLTKEQVGEIYALGMNPFYSVNGQTRIYGQKTMQTLETARTRVNVRHILNGVGFGLGDVVRKFVFRVGSEPNAERIDGAIEKFLSDKRGEQWFNTITGGVGYKYEIDFSQLIANKVFIKAKVNPARTMEWFGVEVEVTNENIAVTETN